ncbi:MAG: hypothetical protein ACE5IZ_03755 [Dehalococcoidia bacterium]
MYILREIIESPWFYWPFGIIAVLIFVNALGQGLSPGQALVSALLFAFFWSFAISGTHRVYKRFRDRGP